MKKFYVHSCWTGGHTVWADNACEAAFKVQKKLTSYDEVDSVEYYDERLKAYVTYERGVDFDPWSDEDYEAWLYE